MNNCMFQYATNNDIIDNTGLISIEKAIEMFDSKKDDFIERFDNCEGPEMAIWIDCKDESDYGNTARHWNCEDLKLINGELYQKV